MNFQPQHIGKVLRSVHMSVPHKIALDAPRHDSKNNCAQQINKCVQHTQREHFYT